MSDIIDAEYTEIIEATDTSTDYSNVDTSKYANKANESALLKKIKALAGKKTARELFTDALWLWYSKDTIPPQYIVLILGAIGYFIAPIDIIPDTIPLAGLLDDAGVVAGVIKACSSVLSPEARIKAEQKVSEMLGVEQTTEIK